MSAFEQPQRRDVTVSLRLTAEEKELLRELGWRLKLKKQADVIRYALKHLSETLKG